MPKTKNIETIDDLPGIGDANATKLKASRFNDLDAIATADPNVLNEETGVGLETCMKIIEAARKSTGRQESQTAFEFEEKRLGVKHITTGSKNLDTMLNGGIETQAITEVAAKFGSSKTQMAFQLSVNVQLPIEKGGLGGKIVYYDSEGTFRPKRIRDMAIAKGLNPDEVLKNIIYCRVYNSTFQLKMLENVEKVLKKENVKLIVVDSLMALFRSEYVGRETLAERQQKVNAYMHELHRVSDAYNLAVFITNQVTAMPDAMYAHDPISPIGGNIVAHSSTYRILLRRSKAELRIAKMIDSPEHPDQEVVFTCTDNGIGDPEE
jgi:DNA repair protein RadA